MDKVTVFESALILYDPNRDTKVSAEPNVTRTYMNGSCDIVDTKRSGTEIKSAVVMLLRLQ